jgi:hypothetical protein
VEYESASDVYEEGLAELRRLHALPRYVSYANVEECEAIRAAIREKAQPFHEARMRQISGTVERFHSDVAPEVQSVWDQEIRDKKRHGRKRRTGLSLSRIEGSERVVKAAARRPARMDSLGYVAPRHNTAFVDNDKPIPWEEWFAHGFHIETIYQPLRPLRITDPDFLREQIHNRFPHEELPKFRPGRRSERDRKLVSSLVDALAWIHSRGVGVHPTALTRVVGCNKRTAERLIGEAQRNLRKRPQ